MNLSTIPWCSKFTVVTTLRNSASHRLSDFRVHVPRDFSELANIDEHDGTALSLAGRKLRATHAPGGPQVGD